MTGGAVFLNQWAGVEFKRRRRVFWSFKKNKKRRIISLVIGDRAVGSTPVSSGWSSSLHESISRSYHQNLN
jgi:hypothetical protein